MNRTCFKALFSLLTIVLILLLLPAGVLAEDQYQAKIKVAQQKNDYCFRCHNARGLSYYGPDGRAESININRDIFKKSIHATNGCPSCHLGFDKYPHPAGIVPGRELTRQVNQRCAGCHTTPGAENTTSIHAREDVLCSDCHGAHGIFKKENPASTVSFRKIPQTCGNCHQGEIMESYHESFHGKGVKLGSTRTANCVSCHSSHGITAVTDPQSPVSSQNLKVTCAKCHYIARDNFTAPEHWTFQNEAGKPMYYTLKFFTWLTIIVITFLILHILLELYGKRRRLKEF